jgi:transposase InsO family protein
VAEREQLLRVANEPRFADVPPARIVLALADEGVYLASESSFHRVLRAHGQNRHRGRAKAARKSRPPTTHVACTPNEVWAWDMTFLPAKVARMWFYLYMILDVFSRKIVGFEVHEKDNSDHTVALLKRTALAKGIHAQPAKPMLHGDNGSTLQATSVLAMMHWVRVKPSYSRPRVSNDNAYAESLFRTAKYRPEFPYRRLRRSAGVANLGVAVRALVQRRAPPQRHPLREPVAAPQRPRPHDPAVTPRAVSQCPRPEPPALGTRHAQLELHRRGDPQPRA